MKKWDLNELKKIKIMKTLVDWTLIHVEGFVSLMQGNTHTPTLTMAKLANFVWAMN